jgi:hypothetical protein
MKKFIIFVLSAVIICASCGKSDESKENSAQDDSSDMSDSSQQAELKYNDLGIPLEARYGSYDRAITPWDMIVYEEYLYIGSGDWQRNAGPVDIWRYDIKNKEWEKSGTVPDEEANRFRVIDGKLLLPGIDPTSGWELGNFYSMENGVWEVTRTIPNGIHCFDLAFYDNKLFAAIKTESEHHKVAVSSDGGQSFVSVPLIKNGSVVQNSSFSFYFDFFEINDKLYAFYNEELFVYENSKFEYTASWKNKLLYINYGVFPVNSKANYNGILYFTTGYLFACEEANELRYIKTPKNEVVYDIYAYNDNLYFLCGIKEGNEYIVTIYKNNSVEENSFETIIEFTYEIPAVSFSVYDNKVFLGMALNNTNNKNNGRILEMEILK